MATPKDGGPPGVTGSDGGDREVDLRALAAQVERNSERIKQCERVQAAIVETLDRDLRFVAKELRGLLA